MPRVPRHPRAKADRPQGVLETSWQFTKSASAGHLPNSGQGKLMDGAVIKL